KKLRNTFTFYIANLAITDLMVGMVAMLFYTFDTVLGYWPFGQFMCGVWIFFDYAMTFASVFTLVAISLDRYIPMRIILFYPVMCSLFGFIMFYSRFAVIAIWMPPFIIDRVSHSSPGVCWWDPSQNTEFVYVIAIVGHHLPCLIIIYCYTWVVVITRDKFRQVKETSAQRERNMFVTLSYILVTYLICWLPFHIIFDLSFLMPGLVSEKLYTFGFWMAYFNSTLNPIIYTYSNSGFRRAFKKVITCRK
ncbi:hypothetical protein CAPTEDRAFT_145497, partial [Capitella teleta]